MIRTVNWIELNCCFDHAKTGLLANGGQSAKGKDSTKCIINSTNQIALWIFQFKSNERSLSRKWTVGCRYSSHIKVWMIGLQAFPLWNVKSVHFPRASTKLRVCERERENSWEASAPRSILHGCLSPRWLCADTTAPCSVALKSTGASVAFLAINKN